MSEEKKKPKKSRKSKDEAVLEEAMNAPDSAFKSQISIRIDLDVLKEIKTQAKDLGMGYQTLINQTLRSHFLGENNIISRINELEKKVFGSK